MVSDEIVDKVRRREQGTAQAGALLEEVMDRLATTGERGSQSAVFVVWNRVNGDVERAHTTGVYVGEPRRGARDPELTVYVDSPSFRTDFSANHEVYLARLASAGLRFSRIEFRLSKRKAARREEPSRPSPRKDPLPELSAEEEIGVEGLCSSLPERLRKSVSQAMRVSLRVQKQEHS